MTRLLVVVVLAAACSGRAPAPTHTGGDHRQPPTNGSTAERGSADGKPATPRDAQCAALIDHMIDLDVAERPASQQPSGEQLTAMRAELRESYVPRCREQPRPVVECALAAKTTAAVRACDH